MIGYLLQLFGGDRTVGLGVLRWLDAVRTTLETVEFSKCAVSTDGDEHRVILL